MKIKKIIDFIFPKFCLHCLKKSKKDFFCDECLEHFVFLKNSQNKRVVTFEKIGPANSLLIEVQKAKIKKIIELASSYMVVRYLQLENPIPDMVIYYKNTLCVKILAKKIGKILKRKVVYIRKKSLERKIFFNKTYLLVVDLTEEDFLKKENVYTVSLV